MTIRQVTDAEKRETAEINELARRYSIAVSTGDKDEKFRSWTELYIKVFSSGKSSLYNKLNSKVRRYGHTVDKIHDLFNDALLKYDHTKGAFYGFAIDSSEKALNNEIRHEHTRRAKRDENGNTVKDEKGKTVKEKPIRRNCTKYDEDGTPTFYNTSDKRNLIPDMEIEEKEYIEVTIAELTAKMNLFYNHKNSKQSNPTRRSYFKIFYTDRIIGFIHEAGIDLIPNTAEAYECSDKELVRFVSYSGYNKLDDILTLRFKKFSDIMDDCKEDKLIKVPFENIVIQKYRFKSGLDEKEVSSANVSIQRDNFNKFIASLKQDIQEQIC